MTLGTQSGGVAVVGCGLIGGSLLRALRAAGQTGLLAIDSNPATREAIAREERIPATAALDDARAAAVIVLALPIPALLDTLEPLGRLLADRQGAIVTDVAGIKAPVLAAASQCLGPGIDFVGAHPMAGKERGGFSQSEATLFRDRAVAICPAPRASPAAIERVEQLWRAAGARPIRCDADAHDRAVARVSHLPHLAAASLMRIAARGDALARSLAAGGLRDTTRVAEDPTVRHAVALNPHVAELARELADELRVLASAVERGESLDAALDDAAAARKGFYSD